MTRDNNTYYERNLQQTAEFILVLDACLWVHKAALIGDGTIASNEDVIGDSLSEDLNLEDVCDDFFGFSVDIWVNESDIVVACDHISEGR